MGSAELDVYTCFSLAKPNWKELHKPLQAQHEDARMERGCVSAEGADSGSHLHVQDSTMLISKKSRQGQSNQLDDVNCVLLIWVFSKKNQREHISKETQASESLGRH